MEVTIGGTGFRAGATARLTREGQPDILGTEVVVVSPQQITCTFDLRGAAEGKWNVVVTNASGKSGTLAEGFAVEGSIRVATELGVGLHYFSVPVNPDDPDPAHVLAGLGANRRNWLLWDLIPMGSGSAAGSRRVLYPDAAFRPFALGRGYMLSFMGTGGSKVGGRGTVATVGRPAALGTPFTIPLPAGWSLFGCPFLREIPWDDGHVGVRRGSETVPLSAAARRGWLAPTIYGCTAGRTFALSPRAPGRLRPWQAYMIAARVPCELVLTCDEGPATAAMTARRLPGKEDWQIGLVAECAGFADASVSLGVKTAQQGGTPAPEDAAGLAEPHPPLAPGANLYLVTPEVLVPGSPGNAVELRQPGETVAWDLCVETCDVSGPVVLSWPDLSELPHDLQAYLLDRVTGRRTSMRTSTHYIFESPPEAPRREFRVEVVRSGPRPATVASLSAHAVRSGAAQIVLTLSTSANVSADILNIAGRVIRRLCTDKVMPAGQATLLWDGRSATGTRVPAGRYLVQVTARSEDGQQAQRVATLMLRR